MGQDSPAHNFLSDLLMQHLNLTSYLVHISVYLPFRCRTTPVVWFKIQPLVHNSCRVPTPNLPPSTSNLILKNTAKSWLPCSSCQGLFILHSYPLSPALLHSQAARDACPFRLQTVSLIAASGQPFGSGLFFPLLIETPAHIPPQSPPPPIFCKQKTNSKKLLFTFHPF
jgi:hypothetical protein